MLSDSKCCLLVRVNHANCPTTPARFLYFRQEESGRPLKSLGIGSLEVDEAICKSKIVLLYVLRAL